jgi:hypothetical protein
VIIPIPKHEVGFAGLSYRGYDAEGVKDNSRGQREAPGLRSQIILTLKGRIITATLSGSDLTGLLFRVAAPGYYISRLQREEFDTPCVSQVSQGRNMRD